MTNLDEHDNFATQEYVYDKLDIVNRYDKDDHLQPAEKVILKILEHKLSNMDMLDIGVGAGRTSLHFADRVKTYKGVDYSPRMVEAARKKRIWPANTTFIQDDARNLAHCADNSFDFVLFSYNGIDYVTHNDRLDVLRQIYRVTRPGGFFCFSTHNLIGMDRLFDTKNVLSFNARSMIKQLLNIRRLKAKNPRDIIEQIRTRDHLILNDGTENFSLLTYFIKPTSQIEQLKTVIDGPAGFGQIRSFACSSGEELANPDMTHCQQDPWIYFLCGVDK